VSAPRVLAIDVSGEGGGVALLLGDRIVVSLLDTGVARGRDLVPTIQAILAAENLAPTDLDCVGCGLGPGSFTGIRIAVATAATLAYTTKTPAIGIGSLHGRVASAPADATHAAVLLNGRRGGLFCGLFARQDDRSWAETEPYFYAMPDAIAAKLTRDTVVLGEGRDLFPEVFASYPGQTDAPPHPETIARIAARKYAAGERSDPRELRPIYLRASEPELRRQDREET